MRTVSFATFMVFVVALVAAMLLVLATSARAATVDNLSCQRGIGGGVPTSYQLLRKQPGETAYTVFLEQPTCDFANFTIVDDGETCFKFAAKNATQITVRGWTTICYDPRLLPLSAPTILLTK